MHLVPTVINIANFPSFADAAGKFPTYAKHMRDLHARNGEMIRQAVAAGIGVHAGTDAGGFVEHGRVADEVTALAELIGARAGDVRRVAQRPGMAWACRSTTSARPPT